MDFILKNRASTCTASASHCSGRWETRSIDLEWRLFASFIDRICVFDVLVMRHIKELLCSTVPFIGIWIVAVLFGVLATTFWPKLCERIYFYIFVLIGAQRSVEVFIWTIDDIALVQTSCVLHHGKKGKRTDMTLICVLVWSDADVEKSARHISKKYHDVTS